MREINLFISHSWKYDDHYTRLVAMLRGRGYFSFKDYSVPQSNPIVGAISDAALAAAIEAKMRPCSAVVIMAGVHASHSKWINKEIEIAQKLGKRIIAVIPWGAERTSQAVINAAHAHANWNTDSIVDAIRKCL